MAKLTPKQQRFVEEYLVDLNATQAALRAGYSKKSAYSTGQENLKKPVIKKAIQEAMDKRAERTQIKADDVIRELSHIAFDDISNYLSFRPDEESPFGVKIKVKNSEEIDTRSIEEISIGREGFKFKLYGKDAALVNLGKHLGLFDPKMKHIDDLSSAQLEKTKAEAEFLREKTKMLKGAAKDTSLMEALIGVVNGDD